MKDVTACLVVHHEEALITRCLESLQKVTDRMVVVHDGPCEDRTVEICRTFGARVFERDFCGMCEGHRVFAYSQVETAWIVQLDADEFLSEELVAHFDKLLEDEQVACYEFAWPYWDGQRYRTASWPTRRALFRRDRFEYLAFPHEEIRPSGPVRRVPYVIEHRPPYDNYSLGTLFRKHYRWIKIHAAFQLKPIHELDRYPADACLRPHYHFIVRAPLLMAPGVLWYHFIGMLALGGFRAGWYGIRNCWIQSLYYFLLCVEVFRQTRDGSSSIRSPTTRLRGRPGSRNASWPGRQDSGPSDN